MAGKMIGTIAILALSLFVLAEAAKWTINSTIRLARFFKISDMAAGFIILSVATSLPELTVSVIAAAENQVGIAVGNVFGSNIADLLVVLGITAIVANGIKAERRESGELYKILFITSLLPLIMLLNVLKSYYGIGLLLIFLIFAYMTFKKKIRLKEKYKAEHVTPKSAVLAAFIFSISIVLLIASSYFTVDSAVKIAELLQLSKSFIGATIIALGTSLPELS